MARVELGKYWPQLLEVAIFVSILLYRMRELDILDQQLQQAKLIERPATLPIPVVKDSLALPLTIWLRPSRRTIFNKIIGLIVGGAVGLFIIFSVPDIYWYNLWTKAAFFIFVMGVVSFIRFAPDLVRYEITEQGITFFVMTQANTIRWQGASYFAMRSLRLSSKATPRSYYELGDRLGNKVNWHILLDDNQVFTSQQPAMTNEEFNTQVIPRLNALVAARTGLPLNDQRIHATTTPTETDQSA